MSGEDANPLNRRLPAEVVTRQKRDVKKVVEKVTEDVQVDLRTALSLKPEARMRWLTKALKMVEDKRATSTELYDIVSNRKFCATMQSKNSQKLRGLVSENVSLFSEKQQRFLRSEDWAPNKVFEEEDAGSAAKMLEEPEEAKKAESKLTDSKSRETAENAGGGWTFTIRERPMPADPAAGAKKKKKGSEDPEARFEAMAEKSEASQKQQEEDVDSSLALLERLNQRHQEPPAPEKARRPRSPKKRRELSRSRSISAASASTSSSRGKKSRGKKRKDRGNAASGANFEEALRRRMQQRESENETSRMPVVDPGHARKAWK